MIIQFLGRNTNEKNVSNEVLPIILQFSFFTISNVEN